MLIRFSFVSFFLFLRMNFIICLVLLAACAEALPARVEIESDNFMEGNQNCSPASSES